MTTSHPWIKALGALAIGTGLALGTPSAAAEEIATAEREAFQSAVEADTVSALEDFLRRYPDSPYAPRAFVLLTRKVGPAVAEEFFGAENVEDFFGSPDAEQFFAQPPAALPPEILAQDDFTNGEGGSY